MGHNQNPFAKVNKQQTSAESSTDQTAERQRSSKNNQKKNGAGCGGL
jgi:hypothetical protein